MSNIHRIGDYDNQAGQGGGGSYNFFGQSNQQQAQQPSEELMNLPLLGIARQGKDPRRETVLDMCIFACCPSFKWTLFIVFVSLVDIVMFIVTVASATKLGPAFLQPDAETLIRFQALYPKDIKQKGEVQRFFVPIFLHANFLHIFNNVFFQLIMGVQLEATIGLLRIVVIYLISGIGGNLFSALCDSNVSVGASTAIFGLFGAYASFVILNWKALEPLGPFRYKILCLITCIVMMNFLTGIASENIDNWGHLGGLLTGIVLSFAILKPMRIFPYAKKIQMIAGVITFAWFLGGFLGFFLSGNQKNG